ncbi:hypothetical protein GW17_00017286 [Ensete ventricosum]|nr:hypothetical protein GW17_00017286 [Ensete ventricosum]
MKGYVGSTSVPGCWHSKSYGGDTTSRLYAETPKPMLKSVNNARSMLRFSISRQCPSLPLTGPSHNGE